MPTLHDTPVTEAEAQELLTEYFEMRAVGFADQNIRYTATFPAADVFTRPAGVFVVLRDDEGEPVGCGGIRRIPDGPAGVRYEVKHLYLRPQTRGRGWGRVLIAGLKERAVELGAAELVLDTHHTLEAAAGLYRATGFTEIERFNDNPNATRWYGKPIAPESAAG